MIIYQGTVQNMKYSAAYTDYLRLRKIGFEWKSVKYCGQKQDSCPLAEQCDKNGCTHNINECVDIQSMLEIFPRKITGKEQEGYHDEWRHHLKFSERTYRAFQDCLVYIKVENVGVN